MSFKFDANNLIKGLAEREIKTRAALGLYADTVAKKMEAHAKSNKPWTDRTGRAKQSLNSSWSWRGDVARVELSHGVDYGIYLEFCNERRFSVISPTINYIAPKAIKGLNNIIK
ncbi:MAG: HK97 gp10 family phage protein [Peptostreptococcaceae bacterium]|nr:HK97 gp10 family phage protein [Peptostreptococcaceae bacterium]